MQNRLNQKRGGTSWIVIISSIGFFLFLSSPLLFAQTLEVPLLEHVKTEEDLKLLIPIALSYDSSKQLTLTLGDIKTEEIDSLQSYLKTQLSKVSDFYAVRVAIELIADKSIQLADLELVQEELKRLGFLKILYVANSATYSSIPGIWSTGILYKMPSRDKKRIAKFYAQRNLEYKEAYSLYDNLIRERNKLREQKEPLELPNIPPPPPPPPPPPELPRLFNDSVANAEQLFTPVLLNIKGDNSLELDNSTVQYPELIDLIRQKLLAGPCLFVIRPHGNATYEKYLQALSAVVLTIKQLKEESAKEKHGVSYQNLTRNQRSEIIRLFPMFIINETIYAQAQ